MLTKNEDLVMSAVFSLCDGTEGCLVSPLDILSLLPARHKLSRQKLDDVLNDLKCDGYFDLIQSERKGEKMYVISLKENGFAYKRNSAQRRRAVAFKIFLAFVGAFATFSFGVILRGLFI